MEREDTLDYIQGELSVIQSRLRKYLRYGYDPCLAPLVDAMCDYNRKLEELKKEELKRSTDAIV